MHVGFSLAEVQLGHMPSADMLKGLQEFSSKLTPEESETGKTVADILSRLGESASTSAEPLKSMPKLIPTGAGLPALPKKLIERMVSGQYIDFSELPPAKGRTRSMPTSEEGHIVVVRAEDLTGARKLIPDLATWIQCFALYMAVITKKEPDRAKNLLAYMTTIAKASLKYSWPSWVVYDLNYRQDAADNGLKDWSKVDPSTYTQCFTNASISSERWCKICQSIDHASEACPMRAQSSSSSSSSGIFRKRPSDQPIPSARKRPAPHSLPQACKRFNQYNGDCRFGELCIYQHKCDNCDRHRHPRNRCTDPKKSNM